MMTLCTLRRMLAELDVDDSLPIHLHVSSTAGWHVVELLPQVGTAGAERSAPSAVLLAAVMPPDWMPFEDEVAS